MFIIEEFYKYEMDLDTAISVVKGQGNGSLIDGMEAIKETMTEEEDGTDEFWDTWFMEINAFNTVFEEMKVLV